MQTQFRPSGREYDIFRAVRIHQSSIEHVAEQTGLSLAEIGQIVRRVGQQLLDFLPAEEDDPERVKRMHLAAHIAAERLDYLYGKALDCFEESRGLRITIRHRIGENSVTTSRESFGAPMYAALAARVSHLGGKLPTANLEPFIDRERDEIPPPATAEGITIVEVQDDARQVVDLGSSNPPVEDCSLEDSPMQLTSQSTTAEQAASASSAEPCAANASGVPRPKSRTSKTVHEAHGGEKTLRKRKEFLAPLGETSGGKHPA